MKCDKDFIIAYNALFNYLRAKGGHQEVIDFWCLLGDAILGRFRELAKTKGVAGLLEYWSDTLSAEGAVCDISACFEEKQHTLKIRMHECPSLCKLKEEGIQPYEHYCDHCRILYGKALESVGYEFNLEKHEHGCEIWIRMAL
jgi:hypothetical protein